MADPQPTPRLRAVDIEFGHGVVAAKIVGPAVEANRATVILESVGEAIERHADDLEFVVFDLGEVTFINSSAVAALLKLAGWARTKGAEPVIYRATENVTEILWMVKAGKLFTLAATDGELKDVLGE